MLTAKSQSDLVAFDCFDFGKLSRVIYLSGFLPLWKAVEETRARTHGHVFTAYMNQSEDRCEEFYQYSCGGWQNEHRYLEGKYRVSVLSNLTHNHYMQLKSILEIEEDENDADYIKKLKRLYTTCSDTKTLDEQGGEPMVDMISRWNWPISSGKNWSKLSFNWRYNLIDFRGLGYSHDILFNLSVTENPLNTSAYIIKLDRPSFALNYSNIRSYLTPGTSEYYKDPRSSYRLFIDRVIGYCEQEYKATYPTHTWNFDNSEVRNDLRDMINFEIELANVSWPSWINSILNPIQVDENEPFIINNLEFLKEVINLTEKTDARTVANYMIWRVIHQSLPLLTCHARILDYKKNSLMWWEPPFQHNCYKANQDRWKFCVSLLSRTMRMAVRSYYMQHYLAEESRKAVLNMTEYIRAGFINVLSNSTWMDAHTKRKAIEKVRDVRFHIAYRRELLNESYINGLYKKFFFQLNFQKTDNHLTNVLKIRKWLTDKSLSLLRSPKKTDNFVNFGALGSLIARKLARAFVGKGRRFDRKGNYVKWWNRHASRKYREKSGCIIERYKNYAMKAGAFTPKIKPKLLVDGTADTIGLKAAYW
ncbi:neprilysin-1-like, partial [Stegodyphus dumicola]|uniref:neprilysin-1-like n=1 Tax=Stegodyphus dumicola TaxID=202533 RepID=UPI0015AAC5CD